ncbi:hypothetical protein [Bradyrhizobium genosp. A]|uniref:hypothetical protein n=1 Tax=Bradyrhizobium genosp. A TaxID=83626 RepID=UPI003CF64AFB
MAKVGKLNAAKRQLDAAIRMFFRNEDMLAIHTVSRAAFRVLFDITAETDARKALETHIKKVGPHRFNEETNFLKHADQDPADEIDDNFQDFTEAGIGMAIGLYKSHDSKLSPEMVTFLVWSTLMRPGFYDLSDESNKFAEDWRKVSSMGNDPKKIKEPEGSRMLGDLILHWTKKNWATLTANLDQKARA